MPSAHRGGLLTFPLGKLHFFPHLPNRRLDVIALDIPAKLLKAIALVALLSLAWAMPANAHAGHGAAPSAVAPAAEPRQHDARAPIAASPRAAEAAAPCDPAATGLPVTPGCPQDEGSQGRSCCGTICTIAAIEHDVVSLPLRTPHGIRPGLPPEQTNPVQEPSLDARPPRTIDIA
ncbi:MAG TPA: hypothetical protein VGV17_02305 [Bosea sp. (in: a-proteobacteria)]|jgi:hypothetical protein|uniref:hypothetical protein n=1 Tax=Bosea sp. (in: a-proteobacteria) TaxID=1871050 RepID=UPI002DDCE61C|nr:hypothetical protein [Bosea sp. (in: a-proteobacteria)]HEV2552577.1 hypothetical protein [Bosea sp. (in: a-proteobacteria)]